MRDSDFMLDSAVTKNMMEVTMKRPAQQNVKGIGVLEKVWGQTVKVHLTSTASAQYFLARYHSGECVRI